MRDAGPNRVRRPYTSHSQEKNMLGRRFIFALAVSLSLIGLAGCSDGKNDAAKDFNKADVSFAQEMILHHRQATEMAGLAKDRTNSEEVLDLAAQIIKSQQPEIDLMSDWLKMWDKEAPRGSDMSGMGESMSEMMSDSDMSKLEGSADADFDQMFLTMMIAHHRGAIEMAEVEQDKGSFDNAIMLARQIQKEQAAEIRIMEALLAS